MQSMFYRLLFVHCLALLWFLVRWPGMVEEDPNLFMYLRAMKGVNPNDVPKPVSMATHIWE
jgi:hypothetical protein